MTMGSNTMIFAVLNVTYIVDLTLCYKLRSFCTLIFYITGDIAD